MTDFSELRSEVLYAAKQQGIPPEKIKFDWYTLFYLGMDQEPVRAKRDRDGNIVLHIAALMYDRPADPVQEALDYLACFKAAPKTLYVRRQLLNGKALTDWAKAQGFPTTLFDLHVTIAFSREPVDWKKFTPAQDNLEIKGGERSIEALGQNGEAAVLSFESADLVRRWNEFIDGGASWDWPSYQPHVTISFKADGVDLANVTPYDATLVFGPEEFAEVKEDWKDTAVEKEFDESKHPRDPGGKFTEGGGGEGGGEKIEYVPVPLSEAEKNSNYGLVPGDAEKFRALKDEWAKVNSELLAHVDKPDGPEAQAKMRELESICKQIQVLHADPGTPAGIGLPGGPRDVVVVGAGPGGLAASINGAAEGLDTLVVEANVIAGGQAKFSSRIENFPGFPVGVTGERLTQNMFTQAERLGAATKLGTRVTGMTYDETTGLKHLTLSNGETIDSRAVIIAGGVEFRKLKFPGSEGPGVIVGDGKALAKEGAGGNIVVVGGSNGAAQAALGCVATASHVYIMARSSITVSMSPYQVDAVRNSSKITVIENDSVAKLNRDANGQPISVETAKGQTLPVKALGEFAGSVPKTEWVHEKVQRDKSGKVQTDANLATNLPGVFAVGDVRVGAIGRIGVAVGEGQLALRQANVYLDELRKKKSGGAYLERANDPHSPLITDLFQLDRENPWFGQTVEDVKPLVKKEFDESKHPRDPAGKFSESGGGEGSDSEGGSGEGKHPGEGYSAAARIRNGVIHTSSVYDAQRALYENRKVELNQPRSVSVLLKKLGETAKKMIAEGKDAPLFNLCNVSVKGTNLFCADTIGIPRVKMPQLDDDQTKAFVKHLKEMGFKVEKDKVKAANLRATQNELNGVKVAATAEKMRGKEGKISKRLVVSKDDYILDGHHHWAAKVGLDAEDGSLTNDTKVRVSRVNISITKLLDEAEKFTGGKGKIGVDAKSIGDIISDLVREWDESEHPRDEDGKFGFGSGGGGSEDFSGFVSPNVQTNLDLPGAVKALGSPQHAALRDASTNIDRALGIQAHETDIIGAWGDGAENSIMMTATTSWDRGVLATVMKGHLADQKSVLVFKQGEGDAVLAHFVVQGSLEDIHNNLLEDGLAFHTLVPSAEGATVYVADTDKSLAGAIEKASGRYGAQVTIQRGRAEFIGDSSGKGSEREQRDRARSIYEAVIRKSPVSGSAAVWTSVRDSWGTPGQEVKEFDEGKHPRDDHGRFSEGGGGAGGSDENQGLTGSAVDEFLDKYGLHSEDQQKISAWLGSGYRELRNDPNFTKTLEKLPKYSGRVYRGTRLKPEELAKLKPGTMYNMEKFSSSSPRSSVAKEYMQDAQRYAGDKKITVMMEINDAGRKLPRDMAGYYGSDAEEVVLMRGDKYKVTTVEPTKDDEGNQFVRVSMSHVK